MSFDWENSWKGLNSGDPEWSGPEEKEDNTPSRGMLANVKKLFGFMYLAGVVVAEAVIGVHIGNDLKDAQALDDRDVAAAARIAGPKDALYFLEPVKKDVFTLGGYDDGWKRLGTWPANGLRSIFSPGLQAAKQDARSVGDIPVYTAVPKGAIEAGIVDRKSLVSFNAAQKARTAAVAAALESEQIQDEMDMYPDARWSLSVTSPK